MKRIHKFIMCLLVVAMIVAILPNDLFVEANNVKTVVESFENVIEGDELKVYFEGKVSEDEMDLEGIEFVKVKEN